MSEPHAPTPREIAGRLNRLKRRGLTPEGRLRLREAAIANQPWTRSTGPRTASGKAKCAANGKLRQKGNFSVRELRAAVTQVNDLIEFMAATRQAVAAKLPRA